MNEGREQGELGSDVAEARARFDRACEPLRIDLHRFCTRMTGSPCDGEDVLQDALVHAFYRFPELRDAGAFRSWIFRIAHNKCIDFLRGRRPGVGIDDENPIVDDEEEGTLDDALDHKRRVDRTLARIATSLPARERACVVLKDVLDESLEETADITGSTVGAVKAALHRARTKLEEAEAASSSTGPTTALRDRPLVARYLDAFNRRDWDGVRALLADEARLEVVHKSEGPMRDSPYFTNYEALPWRWRLALATVDGEEAVVCFREAADGSWSPHAVVQIDVREGRVARVRDYVHVDYLLRHSDVVPLR